MQLPTLRTLALLSTLFTPRILAQRNSNPPCVEDCVTQNISSSFCDGDETGAALDKCTCDTFNYGRVGKIPACVKEKCTKEEQAGYAAKIPALCRDQFFPGVEVPSSASTAPTQTTGTGGPTGTGGVANGGTSSSAAAVPMGGNKGVEQLVVVGGVVAAMLL